MTVPERATKEIDDLPAIVSLFEKLFRSVQEK
jgi:hypothetical protein